MREVELGTTGLTTSRIWLGTVALGAWGNRDRRDCVRLIHAALDAGIDAIDTAELYADGEAEEIVGDAVHGRRDDVVLVSKGNHPETPAGGQSSARARLIESLDGTLRRLRTDHVDLYLLHRLHPDDPIDEVIEAMHELVESGRARAIGTSCLPAERLVELDWRVAELGRTRFGLEQPPYSIFVRMIERAVLPTCRRRGIAVVTHAPLNGGWLSGKYQVGDSNATGSRARWWPVRPERYDRERPEAVRKLGLLDQLGRLAQDLGTSLPSLAVAFTLSHPDVAGTIIGPRTLAQLESILVEGLDGLPAEALDVIDELVPPGATIDPLDVAAYRTPELVEPGLAARRPRADGGDPSSATTDA